MRSILFLIGVLLSPLHAFAFSNPFDHLSGNEISSFMILGERKSGTNYLEHLLIANLPSLEVRGHWHKHIVPWVDLDGEKVKWADQD